MPDHSAATLTLDSADWAIATWRPPHAAVPRPAPRPFDWAILQDHLRRIQRRDGWIWRSGHDWQLPDAMTRREAHFWTAVLLRTGYVDYQQAHRELQALLKQGPEPFDGRLPHNDFLDLFRAVNAWRLNPQIIEALRHLYPLYDVLPVITAEERKRLYYRDRVRPRLTADETAALRDRMAAETADHPFPGLGGRWRDPQTGHWWAVAAQVGVAAPLADAVAQWRDDLFGANPPRDKQLNDDGPWYEILLGLPDPALVVHHFRRLNLHLRSGYHARGWLAHTEFGELPFVRDSILSAGRKTAQRAMLAALGRAVSAETATHMFTLMQQSAIPDAARAWLLAHPAPTIAALTPLAAGRGAGADDALFLLNELAQAGHAPAVAPAVQARLDALAVPEHDAASLPPWLRDGLAQAGPPPDWIDAAQLPPLVVDERQLNPAQIGRLLALLCADAPPPVLARLRDAVPAAARDDFAQRLIARWQAGGARARDRWVFNSVPWLGSDALAVALHDTLAQWADERRPVGWIDAGLDALVRHGSDAALLQLLNLAATLPRRALRRRADAAVDRAAERRGVTRAVLGDRLVPTAGLRRDGDLIFDYGARRFHCVMGPDLTPLLRDDDGALHRTLPRPRVSDDPERVAVARARWRLFRSTLSRLVAVQTTRLEQALVLRRRWSWDEFDRYFVQHPLLRHVAQHLVWGAWEAVEGVADDSAETTPVAVTGLRRLWQRLAGSDGTPPEPPPAPPSDGPPPSDAPPPAQVWQLRHTFRVAEDFSLADVADNWLDPPRAARIGLVHLLDLDADTLARWRAVLHDYEIVAPLPQLDRPVHALDPFDPNAVSVTALTAADFRYLGFADTLRRRGWQDFVNRAHWSRPVNGHLRRCDSDGLTAVVVLDKPDAADLTHSTLFRLYDVYFTRATPDQLHAAFEQDVAARHAQRLSYAERAALARALPPSPARVPLGQVPPVHISELLADLLPLRVAPAQRDV